jgi:hypothetical protein
MPKEFVMILAEMQAREGLPSICQNLVFKPSMEDINLSLMAPDFILVSLRVPEKMGQVLGLRLS